MTNSKAPQQTPLFDARGRKPQQRWLSAAQARADARAAFAGLPNSVQIATWAHLDHLLANAQWRFAATMPDNPHAYTHVRTWSDRAAFSWTCEMIRLLGEREKYAGRFYTVLVRNGFKHWTMNWPVSMTILINRKPPDLPGDRP